MPAAAKAKARASDVERLTSASQVGDVSEVHSPLRFGDEAGYEAPAERPYDRQRSISASSSMSQATSCGGLSAGRERQGISTDAVSQPMAVTDDSVVGGASDPPPLRFGDESDRGSAVASAGHMSPVGAGFRSLQSPQQHGSDCEDVGALRFGDESDYEAPAERPCLSHRSVSEDSASSSFQFGEGWRRSGRRRRRARSAPVRPDPKEESVPFSAFGSRHR